MLIMNRPAKLISSLALFGLLLLVVDSRASTQDVERATSRDEDPDHSTQGRSPNSEKDHHDGLVIVEQPQFVGRVGTNGFELRPYAQRRGRWSQTFSLSYSQFQPIYYEPNFYAANFEDLYSSDDLPLIEMTFAWKRNLSIGSVGIEFGFGIYQNRSDVEEFPSTLDIYPIHLGGVIALDNLTAEPYVVPYLSAGIYTIHYSESLASSSFNGFTQASFYISVGLAMQLNWCDPEAALKSYLDSGIENTFIFVEGRKWLASSANKDPDFETDIFPSGGLKMEY